MLMGHTDGVSEPASSKDHLLADPENGLDDDSEVSLEEILYSASFEELAENNVKYDTIIWFSISLLLVLAWGVGVIMLLYLPIRRYVLQKDIASRKLYVTPNEIVYKVSRPSFIPFYGIVTIERRIPLSLVIDLIIEQGCLQSKYGLNTFRIESIAHGKAAPVDELRVQGITNAAHLRKVIIAEASKNILDTGKGWKLATTYNTEGGTMSRMTSLSEGPVVFKSPSKSWKMTGSPRYSSVEHRGISANEAILSKLEEVSRSVKKIELLIDKPQPQLDHSRN
ncbi:hypothetical protein K2173_013271 [Erythroxylum novogranatense]|uniref:DUF7642 domain-containing protein n=1 Tax=Erythroxylum novogranatense TaxID=1862640 RepID=A0AAV8S9L3_9ROSI|nr:hypothetical protein K2173_013271 [Erythroxylum novogranatense]